MCLLIGSMSASYILVMTSKTTNKSPVFTVEKAGKVFKWVFGQCRTYPHTNKLKGGSTP
ncbi:hypothetical protein VCRA2114E327_150054 [Vibrio crassostreae]|nr:hypothetical protein VCRA2114E327_150054 [Vibrio crassostreae]